MQCELPDDDTGGAQHQHPGGAGCCWVRREEVGGKGIQEGMRRRRGGKLAWVSQGQGVAGVEGIGSVGVEGGNGRQEEEVPGWEDGAGYYLRGFACRVRGVSDRERCKRGGGGRGKAKV